VDNQKVRCEPETGTDSSRIIARNKTNNASRDEYVRTSSQGKLEERRESGRHFPAIGYQNISYQLNLRNPWLDVR